MFFLISALFFTLFGDTLWKFVLSEVVLVAWLINLIYSKDKDTIQASPQPLGKSTSRSPIALSVLIVSIIVCIGVYAITLNNTFLFLTGFFIIVLTLLWLVYRRKKENERLMQECAVELQYAYTPTGDVNTLAGQVFRMGNGNTMSNVFSGSYEGYPIRIFDYKFRLRYGKSSSPYSFTFFEIQASSKFPTMLISSKEEAFTSLLQLETEILPNNEVVDLEGNFSDYFSVLTEPDRQMEIRQILAPDMMVYLMDTVPSFSFIFSGDRLYICCKNDYSKMDHSSTFSKEEFIKNLTMCQYLASKWLPVLAKMNY